MLLVPETGEVISESRPAVVRNSNFVSTRIAIGQLELLSGNLPMEASDEEFALFWKENPKIAVDAFLSTFVVQDAIPTARLEEALTALTADDFQKDGKPKVGPLDDLLDDIKVTREMRDAFWEARG